MTEQFTAADFERELADVAADYHPTARHIEVVLAALRIAQRVMTEGVMEKVAAEQFDVPPEHDTEPVSFHAGWELCARSIAAAIRAALTREET